MNRLTRSITLIFILAGMLQAASWGRLERHAVARGGWGHQVVGIVLTPLNISGCKLWLEADFGVEGDSSGNPAEDSASVYFWRDRSGTGNDCYQNADTSRPVLDMEGINARPAVSFDGIDDRLRLGNAQLYSNTDGLTVIAVINDSTTSSNKGILTKYHSGIEWWLYNNNFSTHEQSVYEPDNIAVGSLDQGVHVRWGEWLPGQYCRYYCDITLQGSATTPAVDIDNTSQEVCVGSSGIIRYFTGEIALLLAYDRTLTDAEKSRLFNWYIRRRFGVP